MQKKHYQTHFLSRTISQWNRLPFEIKTLLEFRKFDNALDDYYMKILSNDIENFFESDREPD